MDIWIAAMLVVAVVIGLAPLWGPMLPSARRGNANPPPATPPRDPGHPVIPQPLPFSRSQRGDAADHAPCAWAADDPLPDERDTLGADLARRQLEHRIALEAAVTTIEAHCALSHRDDDGDNWWRLDYLETTDTDADSLQQTQRDVARAVRYLDLCGLIEITWGDVRIARLRKEWMP